MYRGAGGSRTTGNGEEASAASEEERAKGASKVEESTRGFVVGRGTSLALDVCTSSTERNPFRLFPPRLLRRRACTSNPRESIELPFT